MPRKTTIILALAALAILAGDAVAAGEDGTVRDNDPTDFFGHGTMCAGVAAAITNNGIGIAGAAPGCKILPVRCGWLPNGSGQGVVRMDFAAQGIFYAWNRGANAL